MQRLDSKLIKDIETYRLPLEFYYNCRGFLTVNMETVLVDDKQLAAYFVSFVDNKPVTEIEDSFIKAVRMFINIRIALIHSEKITILKKQEFLEDNQNIDALSGKLYLATYCLRLQNSQKVISIIRSILDSPSQNLLYIGNCSKYQTIHIGNGTTTQLKGPPNPFDHTKKYLSTAQDVIFSRADLSFVPHALTFECTVGRGFYPSISVYVLPRRDKHRI
ncbi:unnamed protein product [Mytilus edulis]|uniref:Uncharacterized protein n=1 Tax=Mytilus edulis TaxID=6550 RepID=A0A8S3UXS1_MYTED|nr:unnamed protein product [Mytilus edulis]